MPPSLGHETTELTIAFLWVHTRSSSHYGPTSPPFARPSSMCVPVLLLLPPLLVRAVQTPGLALPNYASEKCQTVQAMFVESYKQYSQFLWGHNDLQPESLSCKDSQNGWAHQLMIPSTMHIMGLEAELDKAISYATKSTSRNPRPWLLLAEDRALVDQAQEVADKLAFAWFQDNDIPFGHTDEGDDTGSPSLLLSQKREHCYWNGRHLANIALAEKSFRHIINMDTPLPGMLAQIKASTQRQGKAVGGLVCWDGRSDSYFA
ncbi:glycoside hydrolase [Mucidula mucida]|nr:glycoside hydrolase [Mucidula mucida]